MIQVISGFIEWFSGPREVESATAPVLPDGSALTCQVMYEDVFDPDTDWLLVEDRKSQGSGTRGAVPNGGRHVVIVSPPVSNSKLEENQTRILDRKETPRQDLELLRNLHLFCCSLPKTSECVIRTGPSNKYRLNYAAAENGIDRVQSLLQDILTKVSEDLWKACQPWLEHASIISRVNGIFAMEYKKKYNSDVDLAAYKMSVHFYFYKPVVLPSNTPIPLAVIFMTQREVRFACRFYPGNELHEVQWSASGQSR